ncbi:hypothetical protein [Candidatus Frankia nodulisporulans]|uniref:hypothetical protein n=1 Tax=Candidatus Frankia nodulisporulans TaxID=2060052 RepID=UPI001CDC991E|nr:hypothetical protein [Candidatus Frankia nodulisporulans]
MNGGTARLGRAAAFATSSVSLAWVAHAVGGGGRPGLVVTVLAVGILTRLAFGLAGRERGLPALSCGVAGAQVALHLAFGLVAPHTHAVQPALGDPATAAGTAPGGLGMAGMDMPAAAHAVCLGLLTSRMLLAHVLAALLVAVLLRRAERVLWCVGSLASASLARGPFERIAGWSVVPLAGGVPARPPVLRAVSPCRAPRAHTRPLGRAARRRGPPLPALP